MNDGWIENIRENGNIYLSYETGDKRIHIVLKPWDRTYYMNTYVSDMDNQLLEVLENILSNFKYNTNGYNYTVLNQIQEIKWYNKLLDLYNKENIKKIDDRDILTLYLYKEHFRPIYGVSIENIYTKLNRVLKNEYKELEKINPRHDDIIYGILSQNVYNYKTLNEDLIIKLANPEYSSRKLNKYKSEYDVIDKFIKRKKVYNPSEEKYCYINEWNNQELIDYTNDYSALMYADDALLKNKDFVKKYIMNTPCNKLNLIYIDSDVINNSFIKFAMKYGYTMEDFIDLENYRINQKYMKNSKIKVLKLENKHE